MYSEHKNYVFIKSHKLAANAFNKMLIFLLGELGTEFYGKCKNEMLIDYYRFFANCVVDHCLKDNSDNHFVHQKLTRYLLDLGEELLTIFLLHDWSDKDQVHYMTKNRGYESCISAYLYCSAIVTSFLVKSDDVQKQLQGHYCRPIGNVFFESSYITDIKIHVRKPSEIVISRPPVVIDGTKELMICIPEHGTIECLNNRSMNHDLYMNFKSKYVGLYRYGRDVCKIPESAMPMEALNQFDQYPADINK